MSRLAIALGALALSLPAYADISTGNDDLFGWVVEQDRHPDTHTHYGADMGIMTVRPKIPPTPAARSTAPPETGIGDAYGSVLREVGFDW